MDDVGRVFKYEQVAGSDDSALNDKFYYDSNGKLRYVLILGGSVHGSELEHEIYFSEKGERILEQDRHVKDFGQGYPKVWPESAIIAEPVKEFNK